MKRRKENDFKKTLREKQKTKKNYKKQFFFLNS